MSNRKYRKRPVVIEAWRVADLREGRTSPAWLSQAIEARDVIVTPSTVIIRTLEGAMRAQRADWIIRGVKGELYPCKPDIFAETYEPMEAA